MFTEMPTGFCPGDEEPRRLVELANLERVAGWKYFHGLTLHFKRPPPLKKSGYTIAEYNKKGAFSVRKKSWVAQKRWAGSREAGATLQDAFMVVRLMVTRVASPAWRSAGEGMPESRGFYIHQRSCLETVA